MLRLMVLAVSLLLPEIAMAQPLAGLYIGGQAGASIPGALLYSGGTQGTKIYTDAGPMGLVDLGWNVGANFQAEIEGSYRADGISNITTLRKNGEMLPLSGVTGTLSTYAVMANIKYTVPLTLLGVSLHPYVGAGVGYGWLQFASAGGGGSATIALPDNNIYNGPVDVSFGTGGAFAYQAIAGASYDLPFLPGLAATLEYRFFGTATASVPVTRTASNGDIINGAVPSYSTGDNFTLHDNEILVGVRYSFGVR